MNDIISLDIQGAIAKATLCRPPVNAIGDDTIDRLHAVIDAVAADDAVNVLWLRSDQRIFCAGADLAFMRSCFASAAGQEAMGRYTRRLQEVYARLEKLDRLTLAEIGGAALGGGFELALSCDLRIVADTAKVGLPEVRLGLLAAAGGTQRLTRLCGESVARRLILGAEAVSGAEVATLGLAQWVVPAAELPAQAQQLAERLAQLPRAAVAGSKACVAAALAGDKQGYELELARSRLLIASDDTQARVRKFLDKN